MKILYATSNQDKINDIKNVVKQNFKNIEIISLKDASIDLELEETGKTLLENARIKARGIYKLIKDNNPYDYVIGEDFGFFVKSVPYAAGLHAKRWMNGTNLDRAKAIVELFKQNEAERTATFACSMVAIDKNGNEYKSRGVLNGQIGDRIPTESGFAYSQILKMPDGRCLSDYKESEKRKIGARQKALEKILLKIKGN